MTKLLHPLLAALFLTACGDALTRNNYQGEPVLTLKGTIASLAPISAAQNQQYIGVAWFSELFGDPNTTVPFAYEAASVWGMQFPSKFQFSLHEPPPDEVIRPTHSGGNSCVARVGPDGETSDWSCDDGTVEYGEEPHGVGRVPVDYEDPQREGRAAVTAKDYRGASEGSSVAARPSLPRDPNAPRVSRAQGAIGLVVVLEDIVGDGKFRYTQAQLDSPDGPMRGIVRDHYVVYIRDMDDAARQLPEFRSLPQLKDGFNLIRGSATVEGVGNCPEHATVVPLDTPLTVLSKADVHDVCLGSR